MNSRNPLFSAATSNRGALVHVILLSVVLNILMLGGSIYMMLIYDSALPSGSVQTLLGLLVIVTIVYLFQAVFDILRSRILLDIAGAFENSLTRRVHRAVELRAASGHGAAESLAPINDLDQIRNFLSGPGPLGLIDLPWILFFLFILSLLHIWLGVTVLVGAIILGLMTLLIDRITSHRVAAISDAMATRRATIGAHRRHHDVMRSLGMAGRSRDQWVRLSADVVELQARMLGPTSTAQGISRVARQFLQSIVLTVGALLVIDGKATGGVIFASSILASRALAPLDQLIGNWRSFTAARQSWHRLGGVLASMPTDTAVTTSLPRPQKSLTLEALTLAPPGSHRIVLQDISFHLTSGSGLVIVGPSGSGKSSLAKGIVGIWPALNGNVRLDGAAFDQWNPDLFGEYVGYLPQDVDLFEGTVAENISRFDGRGNSQDVIDAARRAGAHDLIVSLPSGYDTPLGADGLALSGGQRQRIGLARAFYRDPFLLVLDEPSAHLDTEGETALQAAVQRARARESIIVMITHRPTMLAHIDQMLVLGEGRMKLYGPREKILAHLAQARPAAGHGLPGKAERRTGGTSRPPQPNKGVS